MFYSKTLIQLNNHIDLCFDLAANLTQLQYQKMFIWVLQLNFLWGNYEPTSSEKM